MRDSKHRAARPWRTPPAQTPIWSLLALLLLAVLIPTAGLLWYMNEARRNEEAAVRLQLTEAFESQLQSAAAGLEQHWRLQEQALSREGRGLPPPERFAALIASGRFDGVIVLDGAGKVAYPEEASPFEMAPVADTEPWRRARKAEFEIRDWVAAANLYEAIARDEVDADRSGQAWLGHARSLLKANLERRALTVLAGVLAGAPYRQARDQQGRWIAPNALLLALERMDPSSVDFCGIADELEARLSDYRTPTLPSGQRRFVWKELRALAPTRPASPLLLGEELALSVQRAGLPTRREGIAPSGVEGVWAWTSSDGSVVALQRQSRLASELLAQVRVQKATTTLQWEVRAPGEVSPAGASDRTRRLTEPLRDWELVLRPAGSDPFTLATRQGILFKVWTGVLAVASVVLLTFVTVQRVSRQIHSSRLKDDLLATVSHELKTPLSSMRVLVDTLLAGSIKAPQEQREYLEIVSRENHRLSGLIESFLSFSRMERGRHVFEFAPVSVAEVVDRAFASAGERLRASGSRLDVVVQPGLPPVWADGEALVTVLLNLLDNAIKYSGADKRVAVRGYTREGLVCLEVEDNGIGFHKRVARRIFERFFQVDRDHAGSIAGVGLGLSIVKHIVDAHEGKIQVVSQPGKGSRFTICLPASRA
jgi:signal transduction histidine kinase